MYNLLIVGDGPDLPHLRESLAAENNVYFSGRVESQELVKYYQSSDLLIFPSHTDTFGMVVLEAQACGVPCLVTNTGGPKEIIKPEQTGWVISDDKPQSWLHQIGACKQLKDSETADWQQLKERCAAHIHTQNDWQPVFDAVLGDECILSRPPTSKMVETLKPNTPCRLDNESSTNMATETIRTKHLDNNDDNQAA